jgi:hypothetical protein
MASSEHLVEALRGAVQALSEAKVPDDLREIAFAKALDHLLGNAAPGRRVEGSGEHPGAGGDDGSGGKSVDLGNPLGKIAAKFHVDVQTVERFFEVDDDGVHLLMPTRSLSSKKQQAMQEVAYLVAAGRQAIGLEEFTGWKTIRDTCENRGVLDSSNFGLAMGRLDGEGLRIKGKGCP